MGIFDKFGKMMGIEDEMKVNRERIHANAGAELVEKLFPQVEAGTMDAEIFRITITSQTEMLRATLRQWDRLQHEKPQVFTDVRYQKLGELLSGK